MTSLFDGFAARIALVAVLFCVPCSGQQSDDPNAPQPTQDAETPDGLDADGMDMDGLEADGVDGGGLDADDPAGMGLVALSRDDHPRDSAPGRTRGSTGGTFTFLNG